MSVIGTLLKDRRGRDALSAWNRPNLQGPETLNLMSPHFDDGQPISQEHTGKRIGGRNLSPALAWSAPPPGTSHLLLVVEDLDVPLRTPAVHCLALIDPSLLNATHRLPLGALSAREPSPGVRVLRSTVGRGYHGPEPIKGHGPHRYTFQIFAMEAPLGTVPVGKTLNRRGPRAILSSLSAPVTARGRLTGTYER